MMKTALAFSLLSCLSCLLRGYRYGKNGKAVPFPRWNALFGKIDRRSIESSSVDARDKDSWKILTKKLDTVKSSKDRFGKIVLKEDQVVDELKCVHFGVCSGCTIRGEFLSSTPILQRAKRYFASENITLQVHLGNTTQWRSQVKLAVQPLSKWGGIKIGLYKAGSHVVEAIPNCRVHHPNINIAIDELKQHALQLKIRGYEEGKNGVPTQGELRYIQMSVERTSGKVQLVLVWNAANFKDCEQTLPRLVKRLKGQPDLWHSITVNFQTSSGNAIFNYNSKAWKLLWGPPLLREKIGNATFFFQPQIFRQANLDEFESTIIPTVLSHIPPGSTVSELYSGIGTIGLNAAHLAEEVICSDNNEFVDEVFDKCADSLPKELGEKVFFECLPAEEAVAQGQCDDCQVLIVDPPRRGLDVGVLQLLQGQHAERELSSGLRRLVYISCGFEALERDTRALLSSGRWRLAAADGFLLFPGSDHIETVAVYDRIM